jgi:hypothetical protein
MDVNRTPLTEAEQDWIDKYREALDNNPVRPSRFRRMRNKLSGARRVFSAVMKRVFGSQRNAAAAAPANPNLPIANSKPQTSPSELRKPIEQDMSRTNKKRRKPGSKAS